MSKITKHFFTIEADKATWTLTLYEHKTEYREDTELSLSFHKLKFEILDDAQLADGIRRFGGMDHLIDAETVRMFESMCRAA